MCPSLEAHSWQLGLWYGVGPRNAHPVILVFMPNFSPIGHDFPHPPSLGAFHYFCLDHHFSIGSSFQTQLILGQMKLLGVDPTPSPRMPHSLAWPKPGTSQTSRERLFHGQTIAEDTLRSVFVPRVFPKAPHCSEIKANPVAQ